MWDTYELSYAGAKAARDEYLLVRQADGHADEDFNEKAAEAEAQEIRERIKRDGRW